MSGKLAKPIKKQAAVKRAGRRSQDEAKHSAILKSATKLFLKNGFTNTTMDDVAEHAHVTKQTVYAHYKSKDVLYQHMIESLCRKYEPSSTMLDDTEQKIESLLYQIGVAFLSICTGPEGLAAVRLVVAEAKRHPKMAKMFYDSGTQRMITLLTGFLKQRHKMGQLSVPNPENAACYFFAMLKGQYYIRMMLGIKPVPTPKERQAHVRETVRMFMLLYGKDSTLHKRSK